MVNLGDGKHPLMRFRNQGSYMYIIDRFEGDWAIIETENRTLFNLPRSVMPTELKEGDVIKIMVSIDPQSTIQRSKSSKSLLDNFFDE